MKRIATCIITCVLVALFLAGFGGVYATTTCFAQVEQTAPLVADSLSFSETELTAIGKGGHSVVVKTYNGYYMKGFSNKLSIDDLLTDRYVLQEQYIIAQDQHGANAANMYLNSDGDFKLFENSKYGDPVDVAFVSQVFSPDILFHATLATKEITKPNILAIYCLDGTPSHDGMYIYFQTSQGDYVYYTQYPSKYYDAYLMPIEAFYEYAGMVMDYRLQHSELDGGDLITPTAFNLSSYVVGSSVPPVTDESTPSTETIAIETTAARSQEYYAITTATADDTSTDTNVGCGAVLSSAAVFVTAATAAAWLCRKKHA